jgi:hypothetical protein
MQVTKQFDLTQSTFGQNGFGKDVHQHLQCHFLTRFSILDGTTRVSQKLN